jgi:NAD-dependent deacetylase
MTLEDQIQQAAELLLNARHAVALTGAGISTPSGIPDFRSPDSGLWTKADPMVVASIWSFQAQPQVFYDWIRPLAKTLIAAQPNPAHQALAELETMGLLKAIITQNIDDLHQKAGSRRVLELHGHLRQATCLRCGRVVPTGGLIQKFLEDGQVPRCECGGVMKPNIVFYGEALPLGVLMEAQSETLACDVMLVAGSSLEVTPAADLPFEALAHDAKLIVVDYVATPIDRLATVVIHDDVACALPRIAEACRK